VSLQLSQTPSWIKESLLLREGDEKGMEGGEGMGREEKGNGWRGGEGRG